MHSDAPFLVYTSGCARTAWLSAFLTYRDCVCQFETLGLQKTMAEACALLKPRTGAAETAVSPLWREFDRCVPGLKRVVVTRDPDEVVDSFLLRARGRFPGSRKALRSRVVDLNRHLDAIAAAPDTLATAFHDLTREDTCAAVFEFCLPYKFDRRWWLDLKDRIIAVDVVHFLAEHGLIG